MGTTTVLTPSPMFSGLVSPKLSTGRWRVCTKALKRPWRFFRDGEATKGNKIYEHIHYDALNLTTIPNLIAQACKGWPNKRIWKTNFLLGPFSKQGLGLEVCPPDWSQVRKVPVFKIIDRDYKNSNFNKMPIQWVARRHRWPAPIQSSPKIVNKYLVWKMKTKRHLQAKQTIAFNNITLTLD